MINRELLKQAQEQRNEEQRKQAEEQAAEERKRQQQRFAEVQLVLSRLGVETSTEDMTIVDADDDYAVLIMVGDVLTGYPLRVWYQGSLGWTIKVGEILGSFSATLSAFLLERKDDILLYNRARFADMLDAYDKTRAEALEQFKAEFPKSAEPAQDETLADLLVAKATISEWVGSLYEFIGDCSLKSSEVEELVYIADKISDAWAILKENE